MRTSVILLASLLLLGTAVVGNASAGPTVCKEAGFDQEPVPVAVTVSYSGSVGGTGCYDASVERCSYTSDPEHPGLVWTCEEVL